MGNAPQWKMAIIESDPTTWHLEDVEKIWKEYKVMAAEGQWSYAADAKSLRKLFEKALPDPSPNRDIVIDTILPRYYDENQVTNFRDARVNVLEVFAAFAVVSLASFEAADIDGDGHVSLTDWMELQKSQGGPAFPWAACA